MADEFRHLTLHVIAESILSLSAEECDETFAKVSEPNPSSFLPTPIILYFLTFFCFLLFVYLLEDVSANCARRKR